MSVPTPFLYYCIYALPFLVAAIVLFRTRIAALRARADAEAEIDEHALAAEEGAYDAEPAPAPRRYISYSAPSF